MANSEWRMANGDRKATARKKEVLGPGVLGFWGPANMGATRGTRGCCQPELQLL